MRRWYTRWRHEDDIARRSLPSLQQAQQRGTITPPVGDWQVLRNDAGGKRRISVGAHHERIDDGYGDFPAGAEIHAATDVAVERSTSPPTQSHVEHQHRNKSFGECEILHFICRDGTIRRKIEAKLALFVFIPKGRSEKTPAKLKRPSKLVI
jgi:hypothetical protein